MTKSRFLSIYLLKSGYDHVTALRDDHRLDASVEADALPPESTLFVSSASPHEPWWGTYLGVRSQLWQAFHGAILFLASGGRTFAITFGHVRHFLRERSYVQNFGLRVTLNAVDPERIKNTDVLEPGAARRQRPQMSVGSDITYFDIERDSTVLGSLTGRVKEAYQDVVGHVTGGQSLRCSTAASPDELTKLCRRILDIYERGDYKTSFPDLQAVVPVRDPEIVHALDERVVSAVRRRHSHLELGVPEIVDYGESVAFRFFGNGGSQIYDDVSIDAYYEYLNEAECLINTLTIDDLKRQKLCLTSEDGRQKKRSHSVYRSLIFDTTLADNGRTYYLVEGKWYSVADDYSERLNQYLDRYSAVVQLPAYSHKDEATYNADVGSTGSIVCLDKTNISPRGETQIEPCDLFYVDDHRAVLCHVKRWTRSSDFGHLVNQGVNAIRLLKDEEKAMGRMIGVISERSRGYGQSEWQESLRRGVFKVQFAIISKKNPDGGASNLPIFSRITLRRGIRELRRMGVTVEFGFVQDDSIRPVGRRLQRKGSGDRRGPMT